MENQNQLLEHVVKAVKYRFVKSTTGSKDNFGEMKITEHTRTPAEIVNHMTDLIAKTASMIEHGHFNCPLLSHLDFNAESDRFVQSLDKLRSAINNNSITIELSKKLIQGPLLDITAHIGQLAMLNGIHGNKIPKESYFNAVLE